jgi:hypothetical protein
MLLVLVRLKNIVAKYPGASLGFVLGAIIGCVLSVFMIRYGFPGWILPVQTLGWAVYMAPVVKKYMDGLK